MSFKDVIKNSVLEGFQSDISTVKILITLLLAAAIGGYIYLVYKQKTKSVFYSRDFNNVLAILPVITAGIVLAMQSSIVISLGMVGALSIVRFRNAVKSSLDLAFLFWSISMGIIIGAGVYEIGIVMSAVVTIMFFILDLIPVAKPPYLLVINGESIDFEIDVKPVLSKYAPKYKVKSRTHSGIHSDIILEIRTKSESDIIKELIEIPAVKNVNVLSHDGEVRF